MYRFISSSGVLGRLGEAMVIGETGVSVPNILFGLLLSKLM